MSSRWMDEESGKLVQEEGLANMKASGKEGQSRRCRKAWMVVAGRARNLELGP